MQLRIPTVTPWLFLQVRGAVCVRGDRRRVSLRRQQGVQVAAPPPPQRPLVAQNQGRPPNPCRPHALGMSRRLLHLRLQEVRAFWLSWQVTGSPTTTRHSIRVRRLWLLFLFVQRRIQFIYFSRVKHHFPVWHLLSLFHIYCFTHRSVVNIFVFSSPPFNQIILASIMHNCPFRNIFLPEILASLFRFRCYTNFYRSVPLYSCTSIVSM